MTTLYTTSFRGMGCQLNVWLETDENGQVLLKQVAEWLETMEACLSRFRPESELSRLNANIGSWVTVSDTLLANILAAKQGARLTNGLYNPLILDALIAAGYDRSFEQVHENTHLKSPVNVADWHEIDIHVKQKEVRLPSQIDLGGVAKGWAAEQIANELSPYGACLVDLGGDIAARGWQEGQKGWRVAIAEPGQDTESIGSVIVTDASIVTSGLDYRRWVQNDQPQHHLIDPRTGWPVVTDVVAATVIHPHAPTAEVYAKAIIMLGSVAGLTWLNQQWNGAALVVREDGAVLATDRFQIYSLEKVTS